MERPSTFRNLIQEVVNEHERELRAMQAQLAGLRVPCGATGRGPEEPETSNEPGGASLKVVRVATSGSQASNRTFDSNGANAFCCRSTLFPSESTWGAPPREAICRGKGLPPDGAPHTRHGRDILTDDLALVRGWKKREDSLPHRISIRCEQGFINKIVASTAFEVMSAVMILLNSILLGVSIDWHAKHSQVADEPVEITVLNYLFTALFTMELSLRIAGHGLGFFCTREWSWNWFDLLVVAGDLVSTLLSVVARMQQMYTFTVIRMLRVLRVTRALRIVKFFKFFREFRMMVLSILSSAGSLCWSMVLFLVNLYLFSVYFVQSVTDHLQTSTAETASRHGEELDRMFGSLLSACYTLFAAVTGGVSWNEIAEALQDVSPMSFGVFVFYLFFTMFSLTNIILGVFVDTAIQGAQSDRDEVIQEHMQKRDSELNQMREIFEEADVDRSGDLTLEEFEKHLENRQVRLHLESIGLKVDEAYGVFHLLDFDHSGVITIEEFVFGCMRFKGCARSIDLGTLMYENKRMYRQIKLFFRYVEDAFGKLPDSLARSISSSHGMPRPVATPQQGDATMVSV